MFCATFCAKHWEWKWKNVFVCFFFFLIFISTLFYFTILYWFCHTLTWIRYGCTWVPNPEPPSHLPPHIISLDHPRAPAPSIIDWWFVSYLIVYMFQCRSPKSSHPLPLPQCPKVRSTHLCLFCCWRPFFIADLKSYYSPPLSCSGSWVCGVSGPGASSSNHTRGATGRFFTAEPPGKPIHTQISTLFFFLRFFSHIGH